MNRIPLFLRTPKNNIEMNEVFKRVVYYLHLPEDISEINLRKIFSESYGNPVKKSEQREKLNL